MTKILLINCTSFHICKQNNVFTPLPLLILGTSLNDIIKKSGLNITYEILDLDFLLKKGDLSDDKIFYS